MSNEESFWKIMWDGFIAVVACVVGSIALYLISGFFF
jgi:hypothetical protein